MKNFMAAVLGLSLCAAPALWAQKQTKQHNPQMSQDMREAIAFEHAKDEADARQARLEKIHPSVPSVEAAQSTDRQEEQAPPGDRKVTDPGPNGIWKRQR